MGAPADGYTFIVTDGSLVSTNPALFKQLTYNPKDIVPVALLGRTPLFLAAHPDLPVITLREFVDYVKAHPGQINYGSSGVGSVHHLSMEALKAALESQDDAHSLSRHRPVGAGAARRPRAGAVLGLSVAGRRGREQEGQAARHTTAPSRSFQAPDVPPIADGDPGLRSRHHRRPVRAAGHAAADRSTRSPPRRSPRSTRRRRKKQFAAAGIEPAGGNAAAFDKALKREIENVTAVVKSAGIEPQ